jgi:hypothetical protein
MSSGRCFQSQQVSEVCDVCGESASSMHLPTRPLGFYCERHCPVCAEYIGVIGITDRKSGVCVSVKAQIAPVL